MKAREKARELVNRYYQMSPESFGTGKAWGWAVNCALIAIDEIISSYPTTVHTFHNSKGLNIEHIDNRKYWEEVKTETQKIL